MLYRYSECIGSDCEVTYDVHTHIEWKCTEEEKNHHHISCKKMNLYDRHTTTSHYFLPEPEKTASARYNNVIFFYEKLSFFFIYKDFSFLELSYYIIIFGDRSM